MKVRYRIVEEVSYPPLKGVGFVEQQTSCCARTCSGAERLTALLIYPTALISLAPRVFEGLSSTFATSNILRSERFL